MPGLSADAQGAGCVETGEEGEVSPTPAGRIASIYYLQVLHEWMCAPEPLEKTFNMTKRNGHACALSRQYDTVNPRAVADGVALPDPAAHDDGFLCPAPGPRHGPEGEPQADSNVSISPAMLLRKNSAIPPQALAYSVGSCQYVLTRRGCAMRVQAVMGALCGASEYDELPVRHNEDNLNLGLSKEVGRAAWGALADCARHGCLTSANAHRPFRHLWPVWVRPRAQA